MNWDGLANVIGVGNQAALQWYSTATNRDVRSGSPDSVLRRVTGSDFSGGPTALGQTLGSAGPLLLVGVIALAVVLVARK